MRVVIDAKDIKIDANAITETIEALLDDDTMTKIQREFAEIINPWTPFLTGALSEDITITSDGVTYNVPYASDKYHGEVIHKEVHPLATAQWDEVAMQTEMPAFEEKVKQILIERAKQLYG